MKIPTQTALIEYIDAWRAERGYSQTKFSQQFFGYDSGYMRMKKHGIKLDRAARLVKDMADAESE